MPSSLLKVPGLRTSVKTFPTWYLNKKGRRAIKLLQEGFSGHHHNPTVFSFKKKDGSRTKTDTNVVEILRPHVYNVFNNIRHFNKSMILRARPREKLLFLAHPIHLDKLKTAIKNSLGIRPRTITDLHRLPPTLDCVISSLSMTFYRTGGIMKI